jgi:hypothetical protein
MAQRARGWRRTAAAMTAAGMITAGATAPGAAAGEAPRIDLKVLVVDNGDSPVKAVTAQLRSTGIPYTTVAAGTLDGREASVTAAGAFLEQVPS